jgi:hypothetical protein
MASLSIPKFFKGTGNHPNEMTVSYQTCQRLKPIQALLTKTGVFLPGFYPFILFITHLY